MKKLISFVGILFLVQFVLGSKSYTAKSPNFNSAGRKINPQKLEIRFSNFFPYRLYFVYV